jgi:glycosyltransferase involved in cell wall biosynthesis
VEGKMKAHIALLIHDLRCGGAELVASTLAAGLRERGYRITLITLRAQEPPFYPISQGVEMISLGVSEGGRSPVGRLLRTYRGMRALKNALKGCRPDVLIGFMTESNVLGAAATRIFGRWPCALVGTEHIHPEMTPLKGIATLARHLTFPFLDALVPVSESLASWYRRRFSNLPVITIPNPLVIAGRPEDAEAEELARSMFGERWILAMGRLHEQKGHDLLLEAFARLPQDERAGWQIGILGEGPQRPDLERRIAELGLTGSAHLFGVLQNPYPVLKAGEFFVLSSRYEGFAIALAEAMACGLPAVAFDCPSGPGEIVRDGVDGLLVPAGDVAGLAEAMSRMMHDAELRGRLSLRAPEVARRFSRKKFLDRWEDLLELIKRPSGR